MGKKTAYGGSAQEKLATYRAKRDFKKTAEPSGAETQAAAGKGRLSYLIQKHAATRLHYDFRLELDGVLKSWAVTRGPSLNPADKRLSVHVEDHPLAYGSFEGTIPKGEYGGGTVMLWDRGYWEPIGDPREAYAKGNLKFRLHGERLKGEWHLIRMHGHRKEDASHDNWLLMKTDDDLADARGIPLIERHLTSVTSRRSMEAIAAKGPVYESKAKKAASAPVAKPKARAASRPARKSSLPPPFVEMQLATLVDAPPAGEAWLHEIKFDGYRALTRLVDGEVAMLTRNRKEWSHRYGELASGLAKLSARNALIDGEVVVHDADGTTSFGALQEALTRGDSSAMHYYAFDLLFLDGEDLRALPLADRKAKLRELLPSDDPKIHYSEEFVQTGAEVYRHACRIALEGIISKRADAPYRSGRGGDWVKSKCLHEQEFVIGGYTFQAAHPGSLGALLIGYHEAGELRFAGKVGTGFTQAIARDLLRRLKPLAAKANPFGSVPAPYRKAQWVEPSLVAQLRFTEWTEAGMLRHPAFLGLREDKKAGEVVRERQKEVASIEKKAPKTAHAAPPSRGMVEIAGVTLSHPDKMLFEPDVTKRQLAEYYATIAELMLPHVAGRPISLLRCPAGGKACFFQRHAGEGASEHLHPVKVAGGEDREDYMTIEDVAGLIALAQIGTLEIHAWGAMARAGERPDRLVFDLDPHESVAFSVVKKAAIDIRERLEAVGLRSFLKTTGGKGLHIVAPIVPGPGWDRVHDFTQSLARTMEREAPEHFTSNIRMKNRTGRILIDYFRNAHSASSVAPYSTRAKPGAPVALPIEWEELRSLRSPAQFTLHKALAKIRRRKRDPWAEMLSLKQKLPGK